MLRSIATVCLGGTLPEKLEAAAAARFDSVEIFENDLIACRSSPADIRAMLADLGLTISLYQPFRDFEAQPRERLARNLDRAERKFDLMEVLGATALLVCSAVAPDTIDDEALAAEDLRVLAERAARRGLKIGYEALAWGRRVNRYGQAWRIVERADHPSLGLVLDSFHTLALDDELADLARIPGDRILMVQVADAPRLRLDPMSWSRHHRCFPGQGEFDLAGFLAPIVGQGYGGPLSLEIFNDAFRSASARQTAADGMRSLQFLEERTGARLRAEADAASPAAGMDLFRAPEPARFSGFEFLEFAVDADSGARLGGLLEGMGFARAGRHRSKEVALYRQGGINLILNAQPDSFAHSFFLLHGPSVCAMAFGLDDAKRQANRARLYHCRPFESRIGAGERAIPAFRQPDGSLIYLVQDAAAAPSIYQTDFALAEGRDAAPAPGALGRVDHVSIALAPGQLDTWLLFYKAVFGFAADDSWFLPDPYGFVRSRAVRNEDGSIRLPLSMANGRGAATHPVAAYSGPGVQHIAFATDDILAAAQRFRRAGVPMLEIPANYYDDLIARHGLEDGFVERLRRHHILYDRSERGEFLQLYTATFDDRFFFEIVERRGYQDYGAANAPVRMAAQAQGGLAPAIEAWA